MLQKERLKRKKDDDEIIEKTWSDRQTQIEYVKKNNLSVKDYYLMFMKVEPYCNYKEIVDRIKEAIDKDE